jgi:hypothetical protein
MVIVIFKLPLQLSATLQHQDKIQIPNRIFPFGIFFTDYFLFLQPQLSIDKKNTV